MIRGLVAVCLALLLAVAQAAPVAPPSNANNVPSFEPVEGGCSLATAQSDRTPACSACLDRCVGCTAEQRFAAWQFDGALAASVSADQLPAGVDESVFGKNVTERVADGVRRHAAAPSGVKSSMVELVVVAGPSFDNSTWICLAPRNADAPERNLVTSSTRVFGIYTRLQNERPLLPFMPAPRNLQCAATALEHPRKLQANGKAKPAAAALVSRLDSESGTHFVFDKIFAVDNVRAVVSVPKFNWDGTDQGPSKDYGLSASARWAVPKSIGAELQYSRDAGTGKETVHAEASQLNLPALAAALGDRFSFVPGGPLFAEAVRQTGLTSLLLQNVTLDATLTPGEFSSKFGLDLQSSVELPAASALFERAVVQILVRRSDSSDKWAVCTSFAVQGVSVAHVASALSGIDIASVMPFQLKADLGLAIAAADMESEDAIAPLNRVRFPLDGKDKPGIPKGVAVASTLRLDAGTCEGPMAGRGKDMCRFLLHILKDADGNYPSLNLVGSVAGKAVTFQVSLDADIPLGTDALRLSNVKVQIKADADVQEVFVSAAVKVKVAAEREVELSAKVTVTKTEVKLDVYAWGVLWEDAFGVRSMRLRDVQGGAGYGYVSQTPSLRLGAALDYGAGCAAELEELCVAGRADVGLSAVDPLDNWVHFKLDSGLTVRKLMRLQFPTLAEGDAFIAARGVAEEVLESGLTAGAMVSAAGKAVTVGKDVHIAKGFNLRGAYELMGKRGAVELGIQPEKLTAKIELPALNLGAGTLVIQRSAADAAHGPRFAVDAAWGDKPSFAMNMAAYVKFMGMERELSAKVNRNGLHITTGGRFLGLVGASVELEVQGLTNVEQARFAFKAQLDVAALPSARTISDHILQHVSKPVDHAVDVGIAGAHRVVDAIHGARNHLQHLCNEDWWPYPRCTFYKPSILVLDALVPTARALIGGVEHALGPLRNIRNALVHAGAVVATAVQVRSWTLSAEASFSSPLRGTAFNSNLVLSVLGKDLQFDAHVDLQRIHELAGLLMKRVYDGIVGGRRRHRTQRRLAETEAAELPSSSASAMDLALGEGDADSASSSAQHLEAALEQLAEDLRAFSEDAAFAELREQIGGAAGGAEEAAAKAQLQSNDAQFQVLAEDMAALTAFADAGSAEEEEGELSASGVGNAGRVLVGAARAIIRGVVDTAGHIIAALQKLSWVARHACTIFCGLVGPIIDGIDSILRTLHNALAEASQAVGAAGAAEELEAAVDR